MASKQLVGVKLERDLVQELRRRADADDRTLSAFIRRTLVASIAASMNETTR